LFYVFGHRSPTWSSLPLTPFVHAKLAFLRKRASFFFYTSHRLVFVFAGGLL
jgi:hypothetical protein